MATTSGVKINFEKDGTKFSKTFNGLNSSSINNKEMAEAKFVTKYIGIVDGTATTFDFILTEAGIEIG